MSGYGQFCPASKAMELRPIVEALGAWGIRWIPELGEEDLEPRVLLWDMRRNLNPPVVPEGRAVVRFHFSDRRVTAREWWMLITPDGGDLRSAEALRSGRVEMLGPGRPRRAVPRCLGQSPLAGVPMVAAAAT